MLSPDQKDLVYVDVTLFETSRITKNVRDGQNATQIHYDGNIRFYQIIKDTSKREHVNNKCQTIRVDKEPV